MEEIKLKGPIEYIKEAWKIYTKKENFQAFGKVMLVLTFINILTSIVYGYFFGYNFSNVDFTSGLQDISSPILFIILLILQIVLGVWITATKYVLVVNSKMPVKEIFLEGYKKSWKLFITMIAVLIRTFLLGMLIMFVSFVLSGILLSGLSDNLMVIAIVIVTILSLFYPLYLGVRYSLANYLTIERNMKARESLKESMILTKSLFWKLLGRYFILGLFVIVVTIIVQLIPNTYLSSTLLTFVSPLFMLPYYLIYKDLVSNTN